MSNDLLFSVLPRRGTVPVKSDRGEVKRVDKKTPVHASPEDENLPVIKEREHPDPDKESKSNQQTRDYTDEHVGLIVDTTDEVEINSEEVIEDHEGVVEEYAADGKEDDDDDHKGINLDVTV